MPPKLTKLAKSAETNVLLDEVKSLADVLQSMDKKLFWLEFGATRADLEPIKTELRLIRSDLAALEKRLPPIETVVEATPVEAR